MWDRIVLWYAIHDGNRHVATGWTVLFGGLMMTWPFLLLAFGVNVFSSVWYWLSAWL